MAKATKVQTCDDGCDVEHYNESESDGDDEPTKVDMLEMLKNILTSREGNAKTCVRN